MNHNRYGRQGSQAPDCFDGMSYLIWRRRKIFRHLMSTGEPC